LGDPGGRAGASPDYDRADRYADPDDGYAADQRAGWAEQDEYAPADGYAGPNDYPETDGYSQSDGYAAPDGAGYSPANVRDAYARDAYARASGHDAVPGGYAADDGYGSPDNGYPPSDEGYDGYAPADRYSPAGGQYDERTAQYGEPDQYPQGHDYAPGAAYEHDGAAGYQGDGGYRDSGPFRWQPGEGASGPEEPEEEPEPFPVFGRGTDRAQRSAGLEADEPPDWDDEPSRGGHGFIPGLSDRGSRRGRRRRLGRVLAPLLALVLLAAVTVGGYEAYKKINLHSANYAGPGTGQVTVQVLPGDTATSLAPRLVKAGVVASVSSFVAAAKASTNPSGLQPGFFALHHHMNSALAYKLLLTPSAREQTVVTIPDGQRMAQILNTLQQKLGKTLPSGAFAKAIKDTSALGLPSYANGNPEGYLFPATYQIQPGTSALGVLQMMVARYNQESQSINLPAAAQTGQMTPGAIITVASILEAEGRPQYYAQIAEVIYNRLNQHIDLGLDSTVNYALGRTGASLTQSQLAVNSPYNTFIHQGLPPGPIDSPGDAAIQAALHPAHGDLLYFVTVNLQTGQTLFTDNAAQFAQDEALCKKNNAGC
jgi:UPF0755 protein